MKRAFMRRSRREKLLLLVFLAAIAVVWLVSVAGRARARWADRQSIAAERADQQLWLERQPAIEARAAAAVKNLDPKRTLDATHLVGEVMALAGQAGLSPGIDPPRSQRTEQFAYHTVQVTFRCAELAALVKFYRALGGRAPYLALEQCALVADRANPAQLNATFSIFSVEVVR